MQSMANNEIVDSNQSALEEMIRKLDNRVGGAGGYVTNTPEIQAILSEITSLVPASVVDRTRDSNGNIISVEIRIGFSLDRSLL